MTTITVLDNGNLLDLHWFDPTDAKVKPDRFGKRGGYRVTPPGPRHNLSENSVFYRDIDDVAAHLRANPDWGARFTALSGTPSIFHNNILIDGKPR